MKTTLVLLLTAAALIVALALGAGDGRSETKNVEQATFAGGCFWCIEAPFDKLEGVVSAVSGYTGGMIVKPTYGQVSGGKTRHIEAVLVTYDPSVVTYAQLLDVYWRQFDPTDAGRVVLRPGPPVYVRHFLPRRRAEKARRGVERSARGIRPVRRAHRHAHPPGTDVLSRGGLPPGLLPEEAGPLQPLPERLGPRPLHRADLGAGQTREIFQPELGQAPRSRASPEAHAPPVERDPGRRHRAAVPKRVLG